MNKLIKIISWLFAAGTIVLIAASVFIYLVLVPELPELDRLEDAQYQVPLRVYDRNQILLAEYGEHRRIPVVFDNIPSYVYSAFVAAEDDQYWEHVGVDPFALAAAAYELITTGRKTRGGSTITMQVARNFFLSSEKTYTRKLNEILLALKIEKELDKEKILELYLNKIYLGNRAYGIVAASQVYYDKSLENLSVAQAAMIAGLPKAPSKYNPIINPTRALIRRNHILSRMRSLNYIDDTQYLLARAEPVTAELHATRTIADAQYAAELVRAEVFERYGDEAYKIGLKVYTTIDGESQVVANQALRRTLLDYSRRHGYRGVIDNIELDLETDDPFEDERVSDERVGNLRKGVVMALNQREEAQVKLDATSSDEALPPIVVESATVLISDFQNIELPFKDGVDWAAKYLNVDRQGDKPTKIAEVLEVGDVIWLEQRGEQWLLAEIPRVEGAIVSMDSSNGAIRAMVGGFDFFKNKFNRATQAKRQPGSNFKPFIYSAALERGFTPATLINDAPVVFDDDSLEATWRPENYSGRFYGPTRMREGLVKSRNLVSIRILQAIGLRFATEYAQRFGFKRDDMPYDLSLALGSGAFSPMEIMRGYGVFSNGGFLVSPHITTRIESGSGEVVYEHNPLVVCQGCAQEVALSDQARNLLAQDAIVDTASTVVELKALPETSQELVQELEPAVSGQLATARLAIDAAAGEAEPIKAPILYAPRVISAQNAFIMRSMMREVVERGTAVRAKALGRGDIGGKTGTTNDQIDAWFSGFNDKVVTTAWVGFDNQQTLGAGETGGKAALPMWVDLMQYALEGMPETVEVQPEGLVTIRIDSETGKRAGPDTAVSRFEIFRVENAPKETSLARSNDGSTLRSTLGAPESEEEIVDDIF